jgi:hypothetical protein
LKRFVAPLLLMIVLVGVCAMASKQPSRPELLAGVKSIESDGALQEWVNFYYVHPRPDLAVSAWKRLAQSKLFGEESLRPGFVAFFGALLKVNPSLGSQLLAETRDNDSRYVLAYAAWIADNDQSVKVLDALRAASPESEKNGLLDLTYREPPNLLEKPITGPYDLDALWSSFLATGDARYIERITSTLTWGGKNDEVAEFISERARRTLVENGSNHPKVIEICKAELATAKTPQKDLLEAVIKEARQ